MRMKKFFYRVQSGDSVCSLSNKFSIPVSVIINLNGLKGEIEEGDLLYLEKLPTLTRRVMPEESVYYFSKKEKATKITAKNRCEYVYPFMQIYD